MKTKKLLRQAPPMAMKLRVSMEQALPLASNNDAKLNDTNKTQQRNLNISRDIKFHNHQRLSKPAYQIGHELCHFVNRIKFMDWSVGVPVHPQITKGNQLSTCQQSFKRENGVREGTAGRVTMTASG